MFKNLVKKIKGAAKKVAPYAGVIAGMFGASPLMAAGIGALGGGLGTGNMKGAVLGGLGGYGAGTMYGGQNRLFNTGITNKLFGIENAGTGGFFNPMNKGIGDLLMGTSPVETGQEIKLLSKPELIHTGGGNMVYTKPHELATHMVTKPESGLARFKDALTMTNNPLTGEPLKKGSMYRFLPAALGGTALAYGLGAFDEEPVPEDEKPVEYVYDAATDPLKNVNKRFRDYYQGITQIPSSSIYGYLQSIGALKDGGVPRGYSGGGSMAQAMDVPGQFLINNPAKTPLSVLEAANGMGIQELESYVDTGEGTGIDKGLGAAKEVLMMGAAEAMKELTKPEDMKSPRPSSFDELDLTKGQEKAVREGADKVDLTDAQEKYYSDPSDEGKTFGNGEFYYDDPKLIEFIQRRADSNGTTYQEELMKFVDEVESFYRNKKANGGLASFNYGGQIMGPGTGREDIIPGKIVDKNTGQTSDMLVSNNEHIIPEYALYAMGGGDTKKGHDMMDALRKQTKPIAKKMGYDFEGAEDGSVMYG